MFFLRYLQTNKILKMNIFVSNLGFHVGNDELKDLFAAYGNVSSAKVITDRDTNKSRGFGFVEMADDQQGTAAIDALNGFVVEGRALSVNIARPKEQSGFKKSYSKSL